MYSVELYGRIRRAVFVEGKSQRAAAREFVVARETVRKMLCYSAPPGYRREQPVKRPKLGPWLGVIDAIVEGDRIRPNKQRHTAKRIFDRLREEHGYTGGYTIVKDYVHLQKARKREMFVPLTHAPGGAQADFGEALVVIAGVEQKTHYFVMDLPQSAAALVHELMEARDEKRLLRFQKQMASYELLIVDELGFVPLSRTGAELLFETFSQRYERSSTLVTSNLPFQEWTEVLGSERLTGALLDRLTHHVHILEMNGESFRLKQSKHKRGSQSKL